MISNKDSYIDSIDSSLPININQIIEYYERANMKEVDSSSSKIENMMDINNSNDMINNNNKNNIRCLFHLVKRCSICSKEKLINININKAYSSKADIIFIFTLFYNTSLGNNFIQNKNLHSNIQYNKSKYSVYNIFIN